MGAPKRQFGPARRIRYVAVGDGGYVAMAKRYREYAKANGLFKTLAEKRKDNPNVDLLVGAVNVWCWDDDPVAVVRASVGRHRSDPLECGRRAGRMSAS